VIETYGSWVLMVFNLSAMILAGKKLWWSWLVAVVGEVMWTFYGFYTEQYGFFVFGFIFGAVYLRNAYQWRNDRVYEEEVIV